MTDRGMKIILTGNNFVGKSSLVRQYVDNDFTYNYELHRRSWNCNKKEMVLKGCKVALQLWATVGAREFRTEEQYRDADGCIIVFSVTNRKSFEDLNLWRNEFLSLGKPQNPEQFPFVVVGTKIEVEADRAASLY
ncbi:ras-related protein Rab-7a-like [Drosophila sulfurigaster albostrigata]|uniref:ras-related protein Rab-7a-like n=1 Tax=Drosophila sulfurigaster albostrigata TaxID=89887 RepID=UPI002D219DC5|nr:ras-related protein Rab-7a-like [Drosophila sulfurigaster albostrigata]